MSPVYPPEAEGGAIGSSYENNFTSQHQNSSACPSKKSGQSSRHSSNASRSKQRKMTATGSRNATSNSVKRATSRTSQSSTSNMKLSSSNIRCKSPPITLLTLEQARGSLTAVFRDIYEKLSKREAQKTGSKTANPMMEATSSMYNQTVMLKD